MPGISRGSPACAGVCPTFPGMGGDGGARDTVTFVCHLSPWRLLTESCTIQEKSSSPSWSHGELTRLVTWPVQRGLRLLLLSLSVAFPASACPGWLVFWANPKNTEFTLRTVPLGGPWRSRRVAGGNCGSPVHGARLKVSVGSPQGPEDVWGEISWRLI